eukprot:337549-Prorocentrum_minimum.AAC.2
MAVFQPEVLQRHPPARRAARLDAQPLGAALRGRPVQAAGLSQRDTCRRGDLAHRRLQLLVRPTRKFGKFRKISGENRILQW